MASIYESSEKYIKKLVSRKKEAPLSILDSLEKRYKGKPVCIVGSGPSALSNDNENGRADFTEYGIPLWVCNGNFIYHPTAEVCWMMDDIKGPAADNHPDPEWYRGIIRDSKIPVISCRSYPDYPSIVEYPLQEVEKFHQYNGDSPFEYFGETINYAVAWAIMIGVSEIHFHGCDYHGCRPDERASLEFWCGVAHAKGIKLRVNKKSHLLRTSEVDNINMHVPNLYGYLEKPDFKENK